MSLITVLNRTTCELLLITDAALPQYPEDVWIIHPDLNAVQGLPIIYWKINGNTVTEMTVNEKLAVDGSLLTQYKQTRNDALWQAAWDWNFAYISGGAYSLLDNLALKGNAILANSGSTQQQKDLANRGLAMAAAVQSWIKSVWGLYYTRRAQIWAATTDIQVNGVGLDFSGCGEPPYPVATLMGIGVALGI